MSRSIRFIHSFGIEFIVLKTELLENRLIVWDLDDSKKLFGQGYYGKPIGIPKPKLDEINVPLILDLIEGYYFCLLYTSPSPRDRTRSRMPSSA